VDVLEQDVSEVLSLVRSMKNAFATVNRIPQEVFSLIPEYCDAEEELVTLTHVCHGWRELFISRSSLWTSLDCTSVERTRVYLERSRTSPLEIRLTEKDRAPSRPTPEPDLIWVLEQPPPTRQTLRFPCSTSRKT